MRALTAINARFFPTIQLWFVCISGALINPCSHADAISARTGTGTIPPRDVSVALAQLNSQLVKCATRKPGIALVYLE